MRSRRDPVRRERCSDIPPVSRLCSAAQPEAPKVSGDPVSQIERDTRAAIAISARNIAARSILIFRMEKPRG